MKAKKINLEELEKLIKEEAQKIMSQGEPLETEMNKMVPEEKTAPAKVKAKETGGFETKAADDENPLEEKMNKQDDDQGHDEEIATAVAVEASKKTKKGDSIEGMHDGDFTSKKDNPKVTVENDPTSAEKVGDDPQAEAKKLDKEVDEGTKTFVEPGAEIKKGFSTGQKKSVASEDAKNEEETAKMEVQTVQLPEGFKNKKEMESFILKEAIRISKLI